MLRLFGLAGYLSRPCLQFASWIPDGVLHLDERFGVSHAVNADEDLALLVA